MELKILDVANYFLTKVDVESGDEMTHLKLQKICYYAQAWYLAIEGKPLCDTEFQAWVHGPVNKTIWNAFRDYGWHPIPIPEDFDEEVIPEEIREFLDEIWDAYGKFTAKHLEELTHQEDPWLEARRGLGDGEVSNTPISEDTMARYYSNLIE